MEIGESIEWDLLLSYLLLALLGAVVIWGWLLELQTYLRTRRD